MVGQLVTQRHGSLVDRLILFGYPVRPGIDRNPPNTEPARQKTTAEAAASDFVLPGSISQRAIDAFVASALAHDPIRTDWRGLEQWQALDAASVLRPTLLLQAVQDPLALDDVHAALFQNLGTSDRVWALIPDGDHAAFMETSRAYFLSLIGSFLFRGVSGNPVR
jgi:pimeloyl-ACP methyl ester carboxylesterase